MEKDNKAALTAEEQEAQRLRNEKYKRLAMWTGAGILVIVGLVFIWIFAVIKPGQNAAAQAKAQADITLEQGNDSLALVQYSAAADKGYAAGKLAAVEAGNLLYAKGQWQKALDMYDRAELSDNIVRPGVLAKKGDCLVNLKKYDEALTMYRQAESAADDNPQLVPYFIVKQAVVLHEQKKYKEEYEAYTRVANDYPQYAPSNTGINIVKLQYRARQLAGL